MQGEAGTSQPPLPEPPVTAAPAARCALALMGQRKPASVRRMSGHAAGSTTCTKGTTRLTEHNKVCKCVVEWVWLRWGRGERVPATLLAAPLADSSRARGETRVLRCWVGTAGWVSSGRCAGHMQQPLQFS